MTQPTITGDKARTGTWDTIPPSLEIPVIIDAAGSAATNTLAKASHPINQEAFGKRTGAAVLIMKADGTLAALAVARGKAATDKWALVPFDSANDVTPVA